MRSLTNLSQAKDSLKYSDLLLDWLVQEGYTHCFFLNGGNIMHLVESASHRFTCIPFVHEVSAAIAADYFNEIRRDLSKKAFVLVTAGPGLTNAVTGIAGAYLESRELLVLGGQVKSSDLAHSGVRQNGIQEIDGVTLVSSITKRSVRIESPISRDSFLEVCRDSGHGRKGPVFIEICLDAQSTMVPVDFGTAPLEVQAPSNDNLSFEVEFEHLTGLINAAKRPVLLIGGGVSREFADVKRDQIAKLPIPVMTTWNGADRIDSREGNFFGRPNTWGMRYSNVLMQQSDLVIAVGTRLGLQQTGFNFQGFAPLASIVQVDLDESELRKPNPGVELAFQMDANTFLGRLLEILKTKKQEEWKDWLSFCSEVKALLPLSETVNEVAAPNVNVYDFFTWLSDVAPENIALIPSSSGASETVAMQAFNQMNSTRIVTSKGLASMGYGLAGAIGAALALDCKVFHVEGDGGFAQNLQELATVAANGLDIKTFILDNDGYASIRMTQRNYFEGHYVGCDAKTGLMSPNWSMLANSFGIPVSELDSSNLHSEKVRFELLSTGPRVFIVRVDPEQTYYPKISSRVLLDGGMESNPLHLMTPELSPEIAKKVFRFLEA